MGVAIIKLLCHSCYMWRRYPIPPILDSNNGKSATTRVLSRDISDNFPTIPLNLLRTLSFRIDNFCRYPNKFQILTYQGYTF